MTPRTRLSAALFVAAAAPIAAAQSVAEVRLEAREMFPFGGANGFVYEIGVFVQALEGQVGNASGVNGFNLRFDIFDGQVTDIIPTSELFGALNVRQDAGGFDVSGQSNSFAGQNFSSNVPILTLEAEFNAIPFVLANETAGLFTSLGSISNFAALTGLPGAFQPSVPYDEIVFGSIGVPTPGALAAFAAVGLVAARRRR